jgi:hypothetical protein
MLSDNKIVEGVMKYRAHSKKRMNIKRRDNERLENILLEWF